MSERHKPHNGRDMDGHFKVKKADVDDLQTDPQGADFIRDDVRLGGAVEDIGAHAGEQGHVIERLVEENRENVRKLAAESDGIR
ncbi:MAG: hypothetical protein H0W68_06180 [Gemmatimonadaceae bacterium]|nr:hypothetical protein [Gemmatimonadaceae bacterium]